MNKYIAALAALASANAFAQSQVSISAVLDGAVTTMKTKVAGQTTRLTGLFPSGMSSSLFRFDGREDLGGGAYALFRLESGLNIDNGTGIATNTNNQRNGASPTPSGLTYNRWAIVGVGSKALGELRIGRVYTAAFESFTPFDPFLTNGIGSSTPLSLRLGQRNTQTALNVSNAIDYTSPGYGQGVFGRVTVATGENPSDGTLAGNNPRHGGDHTAFRVGYGNKDWTVAYSMGLTRNTAGVSGGNNQGDYLNANLSARYELGWARLLGQYTTEKLEGASAATGGLTGIASQEAKTKTYLLGTIVPIGAGNIKFSYVGSKLTDNVGNRPHKGQLIAVGYDYYFSKRTNVYTVYSHLKNNAVGTYAYPSGYLVPGTGQAISGLALGLRHTF